VTKKKKQGSKKQTNGPKQEKKKQNGKTSNGSSGGSRVPGKYHLGPGTGPDKFKDKPLKGGMGLGNTARDARQKRNQKGSFCKTLPKKNGPAVPGPSGEPREKVGWVMLLTAPGERGQLLFQNQGQGIRNRSNTMVKKGASPCSKRKKQERSSG